MKELRIDRDRAIKIAAMVGLAILAIVTLPGLLRTPEPPKLPSDVGFLPSERTVETALPNPQEVTKAASRGSDASRTQAMGRRVHADGLGQDRIRSRKGRIRAENRKKAPKKAKNGRRRGGFSRGAEKAAGPGTAAVSGGSTISSGPAPASSSPAVPAPVTTPPVARPAPSRPAPARPEPAPIPADGSEEFAPR